MPRISTHLHRRLLVAGFSAVGLFAGCAGPVVNRMVSSANETPISETSRDLDEPSKLSPALQRLVDGSETPRDIGAPENPAPDPTEVGTPVPGTKDLYQVVIHVTPEVDLKALAAAGAFVQTRMGNTIYATVHAHDLPALAEVDGIIEIDPMPGGRLPTPPRGGLTETPGGAARDLGQGTADSMKFDHHGFTGKGVIVAVIDTGIDWRHADFLNPDGTTRIKYLWDIFDDNWEKSKHTIGSAPPRDWEPNKPMGTLYTADQINQALKGNIKIQRTDTQGHGTACAGTAAGNGLGVAPGAELVFISTHDDSQDDENDGAGTPLEIEWLKQLAATEHKPVVISMSYGGPMSPHDGTSDWCVALNDVLENGKVPGLVACVSAGNDGQHSMHARAHFGPGDAHDLTGGMSEAVELIVTTKTIMTAYFSSKDDWGMLIEGQDKFLVSDAGEPAHIKLFKKSQVLKSHGDLVLSGSDNLSPDQRAKMKALFVAKDIDADALPDGTDEVLVTLPPGRYKVMGGGHSSQVSSGVVDLYLPDAEKASFGKGGDHKMVVGQPGDADSAITVASYDCCNTWDNVDGSTTFSGLVNLGNLSNFSSAGFRRDGAIKPDITAPGCFMISTLADGAKNIAAGNATITKDGKHVAWSGTSAACPYTAGVVALMLEKNPQLTANQVKKLLCDSADHDLSVTGAVPNGEWGYGKLDAEKAIAAVPAGTAAPVNEPSPVATPAPPASPTPAPVQAAAANFVGTFKGDDMVLILEASDDGFTGKMVRGDKAHIFPITAKAKGNHLDGTASNGTQDFSFSADLDGDLLTLTANNKTFNLSRQISPAVNPFK